MSFSYPQIEMKELAKVKTVLDDLLYKESKAAYYGGYNDCLCDIMYHIESRYPNEIRLCGLVRELKEEFGEAGK